MGHVRVYTISDAVARHRRMAGYDVTHPIGFDAFGLPAENAAIERGIPPDEWTEMNIAQMKGQLQQLGLCFDRYDGAGTNSPTTTTPLHGMGSGHLTTCDPAYYKWTQWLFLELHKHGLAYQKEAYVNWDPVDNTVLANEQVDSSGHSWRSGAMVEKRALKQWFFKITDFAQDLNDNLSSLAWPSAVIDMQRAWIGIKQGVSVDFETSAGSNIRVFTTRVDTIYGVTFLAIAATHPLVNALVTAGAHEGLDAFVQDVLRSDPATTGKRGYKLHVTATHPLTGDVLPVFVADYVLDIGTAAIMGVPGHDARDHAFATQYGLDIKRVVQSKTGSEGDPVPFDSVEGTIVNSPPYINGLSVAEASQQVLSRLTSLKCGSATSVQRLRDWLISRQRYWGTPIPIVHCNTCGAVPVPADQLPVLLPQMDTSEFKGRGGSPLSRAHKWLHCKCPSCNGPAQRETDTMDTFVDSSWYFLRYLDLFNESSICSRKRANLLPVDLYIGGIEHAVLHLLYARFITRFLNKIGVTEAKEPFTKLLTQGLVYGQTFTLAENGKYLAKQQVLEIEDGSYVEAISGAKVNVSWAKMSKSKYNGVDPLDLIAEYGADAARLFILFKAPPELDLQWDVNAIHGVSRWLSRVWALVHDCMPPATNNQEETPVNKKDLLDLQIACHTTIRIVTAAATETYSFNAAVAELMKFSNALRDHSDLQHTPEYHDCIRTLLVLMTPFAPHISCELWSLLEPYTANTTPGMWNKGKSLLEQSWPVYDGSLQLQLAHIEIGVQISGKFRGRILVPAAIAQSDDSAEVVTAIMASPLAKYIADPKMIRNVIRAKNGSLVNVVLAPKEGQDGGI